MEPKSKHNTLILKGKIKDVTEFLKSCEKNHIYLRELIEDLSENKPKSLIN